MNPGTLQLTERWINALLVLVSSGTITAALTWWLNRRRSSAETEKIQAEADKTKIETTTIIINELNKALQQGLENRDQLLARVEKLEDENEKLERRISKLETEVAGWKKKYHELLQRYNRLIIWIKKQGLIPPSELDSEQDEAAL